MLTGTSVVPPVALLACMPVDVTWHSVLVGRPVKVATAVTTFAAMVGAAIVANTAVAPHTALTALMVELVTLEHSNLSVSVGLVATPVAPFAGVAEERVQTGATALDPPPPRRHAATATASVQDGGGQGSENEEVSTTRKWVEKILHVLPCQF